MKNTFKKVFIGFMAFAMATGSFAQQRAHKKDNESYPKEWKQIARMEQDSFFLTDEARRIAENVLAFQRCTGGWPKNIDMARRMNDKELAKVIKDKSRRDDSTIDNNATTAQMIFLARLYRQTKDIRYRDAFLQGVEYLLSGQYENGGWPQFWPGPRGYQVHITFNDDAIVNTLNMIRDMMNHKAPYEDDLIDKALCVRLGKAFNKGIECILATQIIKDGEPSVWCQQNDRETLKPAPARAYELPSYCSAESAGIVRLLMELPAPDARVKRAVHGAMKWFDRYKLTGLKCERIVLANGERDTRLVEDPQAKPIWARYYDLKYCEPYVCDRDGLPRRHLEEIGTERRNGYSWYNSRPAELFAIYNAWADKYDPKHKVAISLATKGANENGLIEMYRRPMAERTAFDVVVKPGESIQAAIEKAPEIPTVPFKEAYFLEDALRFRTEIKEIPLVYVGGLVSREKIDEVLDDGFEFVQMGRALLNEPGFVNRLRTEEKARCNCGHSNYCIARMYTIDMACHKHLEEKLPLCLEREIEKLENQ